MITFKGKSGAILGRRLQNFVKDIKFSIKIECQEHAWVDKFLFQKWLKEIWFVNYSYKPAYNTVLILDQDTTHYTDDLNEIFEKFNSKYIFIPNGCISYNQPLDKSIIILYDSY